MRRFLVEAYPIFDEGFSGVGAQAHSEHLFAVESELRRPITGLDKVSFSGLERLRVDVGRIS